MAKSPSDPPSTALAVRAEPAALTRPVGAALEAPSHVRSAVPVLLAATADAWGDVVSALVFDLDQVASDVAELSWLAGTRLSVHEEPNYQAAMNQLAWWDSLLGQLPNPTLQSELRKGEIERAKALRARARLTAREQALAAHRFAMEEELANPDLDHEALRKLWRIQADPQPGEWRVDVDAVIAAALAELPPVVTGPPISARDLEPQHNFSGFNAINAIRAHPTMGPKAASLDAALMGTLQRELGLSAAEAAPHAAVLTNIFWVALRRTLGAGGHQIAASIALLSRSASAPLQQTFARELLESWVAYLGEIPPRKSLASRVPLLGALFQPKALPSPEVPAARQLTDGGEPAKPGVWGRIKGAFGGKKD